VRQRPAEAVSAAAVDTADDSAAVWLDAHPGGVEENLALDEAILEEAHEGLWTGTTVRTWMAESPVVVVGSSSRVDEEVDRGACESLGVRIVRRPSGGATVVLGPGCLMWSVVEAHPGGAPPVERIHAGMLEPLRGALTAAMQPAASVERRGSSDLVLLKRGPGDGPGADDAALKVSGNALRVRRHGVLYHGTLLDDFDLDLVSRVLRHPPREPEYRGRRSHRDFLANLGLGRANLEQLVRQAFRATATRNEWPRERVDRLVRERYGAADWTDRL
jgi:lipoate---protein ligase